MLSWVWKTKSNYGFKERNKHILDQIMKGKIKVNKNIKKLNILLVIC